MTQPLMKPFHFAIFNFIFQTEWDNAWWFCFLFVAKGDVDFVKSIGLIKDETIFHGFYFGILAIAIVSMIHE